jgi:hypothetical protein
MRELNAISAYYKIKDGAVNGIDSVKEDAPKAEAVVGHAGSGLRDTKQTRSIVIQTQNAIQTNISGSCLP